MPSLAPEFRQYETEASRLFDLYNALDSLDLCFQKLVAEIILLRLFSMFENLVSVVPTKLVAGALFLDGTAPVILSNARSVKGAQQLLHTHKRKKTKLQLYWSKAADIKKNVKYVLGATDHYVNTVDRYGTFIDEIRRVRNRIAHNSKKSRKDYRIVVKQYYGAYLNSVTPGTLLITSRIAPRLLDQYIRKSRIFAKDLVKGQTWSQTTK